MKRPFALGLVLTAAAAGLVTAVAIAIFFDQQSTSGTVNLASVGEAETVYICDAQGATIGTANDTLQPVTLPPPIDQTIHCESDDSGPDEMIFEGDEDLIPGAEKEWDIILWNTSDFPWDIPDFDFDYTDLGLGKLVDVQITEVSDPGLDCNAEPDIDASILFHRLRADGTFPGGSTADHDPSGSFMALQGSQGYPLEPDLTANRIPHVQPGEAEVLRLKASMDLAVGNECVDNEWSISISWSVVPHQ